MKALDGKKSILVIHQGYSGRPISFDSPRARVFALPFLLPLSFLSVGALRLIGFEFVCLF